MSANEANYRWVKLAKHCEATGDTRDAVHARRRKHIWQDGVQCKIGPDGNLYINPTDQEHHGQHVDRGEQAQQRGQQASAVRESD